MNDPNDGGPAFPPSRTALPGDRDGMTLRDYFAAKAMASYLNCPQGRDERPEFVASSAYEIADAMLKAREAQP